MKTAFWHVCYVKPKAEKIVQKKLEESNFNVFLPLVNHLRVYQTGKKKVQLPLFPGYIFVNIGAGYRHHITAIPEVYRFIKFKDEYARVTEEEINNLKILVNNTKDNTIIDSDFIFEKGADVEIVDGPYKGIRGKMAMKYGRNRIVIEIDSLKQSVSIEIEAKCLRVNEYVEDDALCMV